MRGKERTEHTYHTKREQRNNKNLKSRRRQKNTSEKKKRNTRAERNSFPVQHWYSTRNVRRKKCSKSQSNLWNKIIEHRFNVPFPRILPTNRRYRKGREKISIRWKFKCCTVSLFSTCTGKILRERTHVLVTFELV